MSKQFPMVATFDDAHCFNCETGKLVLVQQSGHAFRHGSMKGYCDKCKMYTWFDVAGSGPMPTETKAWADRHFE